MVLCHYPIAHWNKCDYGSVHLYGHIHEGRENRPFQFYKSYIKALGFPYLCYNVGCMLENINYTPRTLKEIMGDEYPVVHIDCMEHIEEIDCDELIKILDIESEED